MCKDRYIVFDVETPNCLNNRISAIGLSVVEGGRLTESRYTLLDPECEFDAFNIRLTGITPEMTEGKPTFKDLWPALASFFESGLLIAHNAPFDMGVIARCLSAYDISWRERVNYACTCRMSRKLMPFLPNHRLDTLCSCLGISLIHHNAGSDSRACAELLLHMLRLNPDMGQFVRAYDLSAMKTLPSKKR